MLTIYDDLILKITDFLTDRQKINLIATSKIMNKIKHKLTYREIMHVDKIANLSYFNNFESVEISNDENKCPKYAKYIYFVASTTDVPIFVTNLTFDDYFNKTIDNVIPRTVTHLMFGQSFNKSIKDSIPLSITHIIFGFNFNQIIKDSIPESVTHLIFGNFYDKPIEKNDIPSSVTHLMFGSKFNQPIKNIIPSSVTHLKINGFIYNQINDIPTTVTHLAFHEYFRRDINFVPRTIKKIIVADCYNGMVNDNFMPILERFEYDDNPVKNNNCWKNEWR